MKKSSPADEDALSMHTTRDDYEYDDPPELPSYSDSEAAAASSASAQPTARRGSAERTPLDPYGSFEHDGTLTEGVHVSGQHVQNGNETSIRMVESLTDARELSNYITEYVRLIPLKPLVKIVGTHQETRYNASKKKNEKERVVDFDIVFDLQRHLSRTNHMWTEDLADNSDKVHRGSWRKSRAKGYKQDIEVGEEANPTLQDWCRDYCDSKAWLKIFRVSRELVGLDTGFIRNQIGNEVRTTHYHGDLDISFPLEQKNIDIYSPHWINRARTSWVRYFFYFTFLWIITWPILLFMTKWWRVYTVSWYWSRMHINEDRSAFRVFSAISDTQWIQERRNLIRCLVLERYQGDATAFAINVPDERVQQNMGGRLPATGNANLDSAVDFVQGGVGLWNAVQGRGGGDSRSWGADS